MRKVLFDFDLEDAKKVAEAYRGQGITLEIYHYDIEDPKRTIVTDIHEEDF